MTEISVALSAQCGKLLSRQMQRDKQIAETKRKRRETAITELD
jgi:hypothetical protein